MSPRPAVELPTAPPLLVSLLGPASAGERERAWKLFLEEYSGVILWTARRFDPDYDRTMDCYAYVLERLRADDFQRLRRFRATPSSSFKTWLAVVAWRLCLDQRRRQYGRTSPGLRPDALHARATRRRLVDLVGGCIDTELLAGSARHDPEAGLLAGERQRKLETVLAGLDGRSSLLLKLRFTQGCTAREIAQLMSFRTQFHVFRELGRVLRRLRCALLEAGFEGAGL